MTNPAERPTPTRALPDKPSLEQLKKQAKDLLTAYRAHDADAMAEVERFEHAPDLATFALHDAQRVLARAYGFASWTSLKHHVHGVNVAGLAAAVTAGDVARARTLLRERPELVHLDMAESNEHRACITRC